ncbi:MAG: ParB/RepB/Spo0J family partition protein [Parcubacteria group bacterium]|nr:ParB/RepB/Spo0J family partition protein [Parcubacteria group bacterium]
MLGRGLESLIPPDDGGENRGTAADNNGGQRAPFAKGPFSPARRAAAPRPASSHHEDAIFHIEISKIKPNPHQPRRHFDEESLRELASSIREIGVLQPLIVTKVETETESGTDVEYQLIAGERRLLASKMAGLERVPVIVKRITHDKERLEFAIIENLQRADLNAVETARAYAKLQDEFGLTQREIASRIGKSREAVANTLRLLNLPSEIQDAVGSNKINESQARTLLAVSDIAEQQRLFRELLSGNMTVRQLRSRIQNSNRAGITDVQGEHGLKAFDPEAAAAEERLAEALGTKVRVERSGETGKIIITFYSPEELHNIIKKFGENSV